MNLFNIMGLVSTLALALPIIILLTSKLAWYRSFPALFFYYLVLLSYNLILLGYIETGSNFRDYHRVVNNLLNIPLILMFLLYFSKTIYSRKKMLMTIIAFIGFEILVVAFYGFNANAASIILAPGLLLALVISLLFFVHQVKISVVYHKAVGKAIMVSSLLFAYVGYSFVYAVFLLKPDYKNDAHLVYFLVTIFSSIAIAAGIYIERSRVKQLAELQTTREELKVIYHDGQETKKMTAPAREAVVLNFDKEQWS
jgi:hypothetical protein